MRNLLVVLCLAVATGCSESKPQPAAQTSSVIMTTCHPVDFVVNRVAGNACAVECPLPAGADPAGWSPPRDILASYQNAKLIFVNGIGFEHWVTHTSLPTNRLHDLSTALTEPLIWHRKRRRFLDTTMAQRQRLDQAHGTSLGI